MLSSGLERYVGREKERGSKNVRGVKRTKNPKKRTDLVLLGSDRRKLYLFKKAPTFYDKKENERTDELSYIDLLPQKNQRTGKERKDAKD